MNNGGSAIIHFFKFIIFLLDSLYSEEYIKHIISQKCENGE